MIEKREKETKCLEFMVMEPLSARARSEFWRIIFNLFQSRVTDFRFHWKTVSLIHFWNVAKEYLVDGISPPGSTNSAREFTHTRLLIRNLSTVSHHKRMNDWCPWLSCCVILSSYGKHECQICVNIRCTRPLVRLLGVLFRAFTRTVISSGRCKGVWWKYLIHFFRVRGRKKLT